MIVRLLQKTKPFQIGDFQTILLKITGLTALGCWVQEVPSGKTDFLGDSLQATIYFLPKAKAGLALDTFRLATY